MKQGDRYETQLGLDFTVHAAKDEATPAAKILPFVDAETRRSRAAAIKRVMEAGVFRLPPGLINKVS